MENEKKVDTIKSLKKELREFKSEMLEMVNKIIEAKEGVAPIKTVETIKVDEGGAQEVGTSTTLPANYQFIFEEYFDPADGFTAEMSFENNIEFTINVPIKFSNASEAHLTLYKKDRRVKVLQQGDIEGGIKEYCILVAKNLKYDKSLLTK